MLHNISLQRSFDFLIILAGFPTTVQLSGIDLLTIHPAPIVTLFPILIPPNITALGHIHTLFPIIGESIPPPPRIH